MRACGEYWQEKVRTSLEALGLTYDELAEAIRLEPWGKYPEDGIDEEALFESIIALASRLVARERQAHTTNEGSK